MTAKPGDSTVNRMVAASVVGSVWTLLSRVSGLLRLVVVAAVLGPTQFGNLYQASNQLPNLIFDLLAGFLLASIIVPALVRHLDLGDMAAMERLASGFLSLTLLAATAVVVAGVAAGPLILKVLTITARPDNSQPDDKAAWLLLALLLLQVPLYALAGIGAAVQNARDRYALAAGAPAVENVGIIVTLLAFSAASHSAEGQLEYFDIILLGGGTTASVALHAGLQWLGARRQGVRLGLRNGWRDPEARYLVRLAVPSLAYTSLSVARYGVVLVVASAVPGGVVAFNLALAFYFLPTALAARPVAQAALPGLSRAYHRSDDAEFGVTLTRALQLALFLTVPAAAGYMLVSEPLSAAVTFGDMATAEGRLLVRACLLGVGLGVAGDAVMDLCTRASYARRDARLPLVLQLLRSGLGVGGMLISLALLDGPHLLVGIGISVAASDLVAGTLICLALRRRLPARSLSVGRPLARILVSTLAMLPVVGVLQAALPDSVNQLACMGNVLASAVLGAVTYLVAQRLLSSPELQGIRTMLSVRSR